MEVQSVTAMRLPQSLATTFTVLARNNLLADDHVRLIHSIDLLNTGSEVDGSAHMVERTVLDLRTRHVSIASPEV